MSVEPKTKDLERAIDSLINQREVLAKERDSLHRRLVKVNTQMAELAQMISRLMISFRMLHGVLPTRYNPPSMPIFPRPPLGPNAKIGDAIEAILKEAKRPLTKDEIVDKLREYGVGISLNNPKIVLAIAIKRDKNKRFKVGAGKVSFTPEWEKMLLHGEKIREAISRVGKK